MVVCVYIYLSLIEAMTCLKIYYGSFFVHSCGRGQRRAHARTCVVITNAHAYPLIILTLTLTTK